jgi:hypothetical protein
MINQETKDKLMGYVVSDIEAAELYYEEHIEPAALRRLQRFMSDKDYYKGIFPKLSERSNFTMSDVADTVYWAVPSLMKIFFGGQDVVSITPRTPDDTQHAEAMQVLCNWQIQKKNKGFLKFYRWILDALQLGHGITKIRWERIEKEVETVVQMTPEELLDLDTQADQVKFVKAEELPDGTYSVTVREQKITKNQPILENVPVSEFAWLPDASDIRDLNFCMHKKLMTRSEIEVMVKSGIFDKVDENKIAGAKYSDFDKDELRQYQDPSSFTHDGASGLDPSRQQYWVQECFGKYDINDDNISESLIITVIGDQIIRVEENEMGRPHFAVLSPYPHQYELGGRTFDDLIGELQDIKVALMRQIIVNIANNNDRQAIVDQDAINPDDLRDNKRFIRAKSREGQPVGAFVSYMPESPTSPMAMPMVEYLDQVKENRTGITKYNQGMDSKSLNKTATGITAIMGAATQRLEMIARIFAETGVLDLFEILVEMNSRYIDNEQVVRLTESQGLVVRPEDLAGEFDLDIAAGVGAGQRQEATQNMMLLIGQIYPAMLQMGVPPEIMTGKAVEAVKTLVEQMGYKDSSKYAPTAEEIQQHMMQQQEMMMQQQAQAEQTLAQMTPEQIEAAAKGGNRGQ